MQLFQSGRGAEQYGVTGQYAAWQMFCAIIVLPSPLVPIKIGLWASGRKSNVRARSMTLRSILVGQDQLKSAMGLNFLISERRRRRSGLRWARRWTLTSW